jgi:hypothetical protein
MQDGRQPSKAHLMGNTTITNSLTLMYETKVRPTWPVKLNTFKAVIQHHLVKEPRDNNSGVLVWPTSWDTWWWPSVPKHAAYIFAIKRRKSDEQARFYEDGSNIGRIEINLPINYLHWNIWRQCKIWGVHGGHYEECRLLGYKTPVRTSQETHYVSTTESSRLMLCKIWGFHGGDYEECRLLGYKIPVRTSQETHYCSATESRRLMLYTIWGFHDSDYEGRRLLGRVAVWLL